MANGKNDIQQIPLTGTLNMNTLKTDVHQFEGYNEKNSTVFGGALSPIWDKETELYPTNKSYTTFNSNGEAITLLRNNDTSISIIKTTKEGHQELLKAENVVATESKEIKTRPHTIVAVENTDGYIYGVTKDRVLYKDLYNYDTEEYTEQNDLATFTGLELTEDEKKVEDLPDDIEDVFDARILIDGTGIRAIATSYVKCEYIRYFSEHESYRESASMPTTQENIPLITMGFNPTKENNINNFYCYVISKSGITQGDNTVIEFKDASYKEWITAFNFTFIRDISHSTVDYYYTENYSNPSYLKEKHDLSTVAYFNKYPTAVSVKMEIQQYAFRYLVKTKYDTYVSEDKYYGELNEMIPCPLGIEYSKDGTVYYQNGALISLGHLNEQIDSCLAYDRAEITKIDKNSTVIITYQKSDGSWHSYKAFLFSTIADDYTKYLQKMIFDSKYIFIKDYTNGLRIYDIEKETLKDSDNQLDWIISEAPYSTKEPIESYTTYKDAERNKPFTGHITLRARSDSERGTHWDRDGLLISVNFNTRIKSTANISVTFDSEEIRQLCKGVHKTFGVDFYPTVSVVLPTYWNNNKASTNIVKQVTGFTQSDTIFGGSVGWSDSIGDWESVTSLKSVRDDEVYISEIVLYEEVDESGVSTKVYASNISKSTTEWINGAYQTKYTFEAVVKETVKVVDEAGFTNKTTGCMYGAAYNAGYLINGEPFVGYTPNPFITTHSPKNDIVYPSVPSSVQYYCSIGDSVQSANYIGKDSAYFGTVYAIDANGNIMLPTSLNAEVLSGYSNNDLVREGNSIYPLIYSNNNTKTYSYFLLSSVENMEDMFSLQGQSYVMDANNIYAITFNNGVINAVTPVSYRKNMRFVGTLPTSAVFWSDFNKTFYAFTGDRVLTKMFEASDIDTLNFVGQNSASLSLWIATDKGIYVMSDTDIYKLPYKATKIEFFKDSALIIEDKIKDDKVIDNLRVVSFYPVYENSKMNPIKLKTCYYGIGSEKKAVYDCFYVRFYNKDKKECDITGKVNTITNISKQSKEITYHITAADYDENNIVYKRFQPEFQECVALQLELESPIAIYSINLGMNAGDAVAQISKESKNVSTARF